VACDEVFRVGFCLERDFIDRTSCVYVLTDDRMQRGRGPKLLQGSVEEVVFFLVSVSEEHDLYMSWAAMVLKRTARSSHQENTESASTRLKRLERRSLSSLTVSSKRIETHKIGAEYFFLYLKYCTGTVF